MKVEYNVKFLDENHQLIESILVGAETFVEARAEARAAAKNMGLHYSFLKVRRGVDRAAYQRELYHKKHNHAYDDLEVKDCDITILLPRYVEKKLLEIATLTGAVRTKIAYPILKAGIEQMHATMMFPDGKVKETLSRNKGPKVFLANVKNGEVHLVRNNEEQHANPVMLWLTDSDYAIIKKAFEKNG